MVRLAPVPIFPDDLGEFVQLETPGMYYEFTLVTPAFHASP
jgi:hypothetical protein